MRKIIATALIAFSLIGGTSQAYAEEGIKRSQWDYGPEITFGNVYYGLILGEALNIAYTAIFGEDRPHWAPNVITKIQIYSGTSLYRSEVKHYDRINKDITSKHRVFGGKEKDPKWYDPDFNNFSVGYGVNYMSKELPLGFAAKLSYEQAGWKIHNEETSYGYAEGDYTFRKQMIVTEAMLKIRLGNYRTHMFGACIDLGGSYDGVVGGKCLSFGKDAYNSGFSGIAGFSFAIPTIHLQVGADMYFPTYKYFKDLGEIDSFNDSRSMSVKCYINLGF